MQLDPVLAIARPEPLRVPLVDERAQEALTDLVRRNVHEANERMAAGAAATREKDEDPLVRRMVVPLYLLKSPREEYLEHTVTLQAMLKALQALPPTSGLLEKQLMSRAYQYYYATDWPPRPASLTPPLKRSESVELPNFRDIAALCVSGPRTVRHNFVFRGAAPLCADVTALEYLMLERFRIRTVIDLRGRLPVTTAAQRRFLAFIHAYFAVFHLRPTRVDSTLTQFEWARHRPGLDFVERVARSWHDPREDLLAAAAPPTDLADERRMLARKTPRRWFLVDLYIQQQHADRAISDVSQGPLGTVPTRLARRLWRCLRRARRGESAQGVAADNAVTQSLVDFVAPLVLSPALLHAVFRLLLEREPPFFLLSTWGKDRVGLIVLLLMQLLGASEEDIIADLCATDAGLRPLRRSAFSYFAFRGLPRAIFDVDTRCYRFMLDFVARNWGSVHAYLASIGFAGPLQERLRAKFGATPSLSPADRLPFAPLMAVDAPDAPFELDPSVPIRAKVREEMARGGAAPPPAGEAGPAAATGESAREALTTRRSENGSKLYEGRDYEVGEGSGGGEEGGERITTLGKIDGVSSQSRDFSLLAELPASSQASPAHRLPPQEASQTRASPGQVSSAPTPSTTAVDALFLPDPGPGGDVARINRLGIALCRIATLKQLERSCGGPSFFVLAKAGADVLARLPPVSDADRARLRGVFAQTQGTAIAASKTANEILERINALPVAERDRIALRARVESYATRNRELQKTFREEGKRTSAPHHPPDRTLFDAKSRKIFMRQL